jgi:hypothetical protein
MSIAMDKAYVILREQLVKEGYEEYEADKFVRVIFGKFELVGLVIVLMEYDY